MRVLIVGDSPHINTGFGRVNSIAADAFLAKGWDVAAVAGLTDKAPENDRGIRTYVPKGIHKGDSLGLRLFETAIKEHKPDMVYMTADTGTLAMLTQVLPAMPSFNYQAIEGAPIVNRFWKTVITGMPFLACSKYGVDIVKTQFGLTRDFAYHGVNHEVFNPSDIRDEVRRAMKWEDKFVITCVSTNVRRKQLPRLIEAFSILKHEYKQKDIVLYLHTIPFNNHWLEGWNLMDVARMFNVENDVFFNPVLNKFGASVPERTGEPRNPGLAEMYGASDLFVLPSQVEGFGLPIAEAMACGLPVMVTKYAAGWEVASPAGRGIPVSDWEVHKSGTLYGNVNVRALAQEILRLKRNPKERQRMSEAGIRRAQDFQWSTFTEKLIPAMEQELVTYQERNPTTQEPDTTEEARREDEHLREDASKGALQEVSVQPEGQGEDTVREEA